MSRISGDCGAKIPTCSPERFYRRCEAHRHSGGTSNTDNPGTEPHATSPTACQGWEKSRIQGEALSMNWMQDVMDAKKRGATFPGDREECEMTDQIKQWLQDRRDSHANTTGCWEHDATEDGTNFWAGGGRSDFHLTVADAAFCVDAHNVAVPALLDALGKALELHKPEEYEDPAGTFFCRTCGDWNMCEDPMGEQPDYPCPTVRAIEGAINE